MITTTSRLNSMVFRDVRKGRCQELRRLLESSQKDDGGSGRRFYDDLSGAFRDKHVTAEDFGIRNLFESLVDDGAELVQHFNPRLAGYSTMNVALLEAQGHVSTAAFANITGQIVFTAVLDAYNSPEYIWPRLFKTVPTEFDGEKIPGVGGIGDMAEVVGEGQQYPFAGLNEEWVMTPDTIKRGLIVPVTKEAIFFDRTGLVVKRASGVGDSIAINKEKRCLDVALGITTTYRRNGGAAQATYGDTHTNGDFDNLQATNALVDWTDIENAELLFDAITDPNTGEPVLISAKALIVPTALKRTAERIVNATQIAFGDGASNTTRTYGKSPTGPQYEVISNAYVKARTGSATTWFMGDPQRAFQYMENWPVTVVQAPPDAPEEFHRDIVSSFKASERGAAAVIDPRFMVKCTA